MFVGIIVKNVGLNYFLIFDSNPGSVFGTGIEFIKSRVKN